MSRDDQPGRRVPESDPGDEAASPAGAGRTGRSGQDGRDDQSGLPPFVSTWGGFYRLVLSTFLGLILLFYAIQAAFR